MRKYKIRKSLCMCDRKVADRDDLLLAVGGIFRLGSSTSRQ